MFKSTFTGLLAGFAILMWVPAQALQTVHIAYLAQEKEIPPPLSNLDPFIEDKGLQGARLGIADNNTTGRFTGQAYILHEIIVPKGEDINRSYKMLMAEGYPLVIANLDPVPLKNLANLSDSDAMLLLDVGTIDDELRRDFCRPNLFYFLPSRAMRADALGQYMLKKRWQDWFLVIGPGANDQLFAEAIKRSAKRFGMKLVAQKNWTHTYDSRRTAQADVPVFTQDVGYDVLVVADEAGLFGEYLEYRTWLPRPVIGTQGLVATSWHRTHEQWGAVQIQNRFRDRAGRGMQEEDYGAYLAARSIAEAVTRTRQTDIQAIQAYLLDEQFVIPGYKGKPLSFRPWNGQLRQPVLLAAARSMVAVAPLEGFLHPQNELDTLGIDRPEMECTRDNRL